jgi:hypothetical protein
MSLVVQEAGLPGRSIANGEGKPQTVWVLRPVEHEVSPYRFVRAVKAFREEVTRVGEPLKLRGRRKTRGKCDKGRPQDGRRDRRRP